MITGVLIGMGIGAVLAVGLYVWLVRNEMRNW